MLSLRGSDRIRTLRRLRRYTWLMLWVNLALACWHMSMHRLTSFEVALACVALCLLQLWWNGRQQERYFSRYD